MTVPSDWRVPIFLTRLRPAHTDPAVLIEVVLGIAQYCTTPARKCCVAAAQASLPGTLPDHQLSRQESRHRDGCGERHVARSDALFSMRGASSAF